MGILNVTPDSFSDGGVSLDTAAAVSGGLAMVADGAAIIDIGGESTRPGAVRVEPLVEQARILPVIAGLRDAGVLLSVDTRNASTMTAALDAGAAIVNDVSALSHDPAAAGVVAARRCPVILMHMRGTPETMAGLADYDDVVATVRVELSQRIEQAMARGVARTQVAVDPGFGFAKDAAQNLALLRGLRGLCDLGFPMVAGLSRKRFLGALGGHRRPMDRDAESLAAGLFALEQGATILRVHDVAGTVSALRVWKALTV